MGRGEGRTWDAYMEVSSGSNNLIDIVLLLRLEEDRL